MDKYYCTKISLYICTNTDLKTSFRWILYDLPNFVCAALSSTEDCTESFNLLEKYDPNVLLVVFCVDSQVSLEKAESILAFLRREKFLEGRLGFLVANKVDLVKKIVVKSEDGSTLARRYDVRYIEVSAGLQYNIDELLVRMVKEMLSIKQGKVRDKKLSIAEKMKGLMVRRRSRSRSQDKEECRQLNDA